MEADVSGAVLRGPSTGATGVGIQPSMERLAVAFHLMS